MKTGTECIVRLSPKDVEQDDLEATRDDERVNRNGWTGFERGTCEVDPEERLKRRKIGYRGERAAALFFGFANWRREKDGFHSPDVGMFYVRTTLRRGSSLKIGPKDEARFGHLLVALVSGDLLTFEIMGWLAPGEGIGLREKGIGIDLPPRWGIPVDRLHAIDTIPRHLLDESGRRGRK